MLHALVAALALTFPSGGGGDDAARARDPWARFQPGSWVRFKTVNDYVIEGKKRHDESFEKITLKAVTDVGVKLVTESRGFEGDQVTEATRKFFDEKPATAADGVTAAEEKLTIDGREIACRVVQFDETEKVEIFEFHVSGTAWINDAYPTPLKLRSKMTVGDESSESEATAEKLDVEIKIGERTLHCVEVVRRDVDPDEKTGGAKDGTNRGGRKSVTREWFSADMPGALVRRRSEATGGDSHDVFFTEVSEFFVAPVPPVSRVAEPLPAPPAKGACRITGRFVDADGRPLEGLSVDLNGSVYDVAAASKAGAAQHRSHETAKTDAEGRLAVEVVPAPGTEFFFEVAGPGLAKVEWRFRSLVAGGRVDVGEIRMEPAGTIVGRLLTADGQPVPGGYYVAARRKDEPERPRGDEREGTYEYGMPEKGSTDFKVESLPAGTYELSPYLHVIGWYKEGEQTVEVKAGQETRVELRYAGPALDHRIQVVVFVQPQYTLNPTIDHVSLTTPDGRTLAASHGGIQSFNFEDVPDGSCTLVIDDPRFEKVRKEGLRGGTRTDVRLRGAASLVVVARDSKSAASLTDLAVSQELLKSRTSPRRFTLRGLGGPPLVDGVVTGVIPGDSRVYVGAAGYAEKSVDVTGLAADERRTIEVALSAAANEPSAAPATVGGVVLDAKSRKPVAGVAVSARCTDRDERQSKSATTGADGRFQFVGLEPGNWDVQVKLSETIESAHHRFELEGGEERGDLEIEIGRGADLSGRVAGISAFQGGTTSLLFMNKDSRFAAFRGFGDDDERFAWFGSQRVPLERDGSYSSKYLASGHYRVGLEIGGGEVTIGASHTMQSPRHKFTLGDIDVSDEPSQRFDFDAGAFAPASVTLHVDGDATLRSTLVAVARSAEPPKKREEPDSTISFGDDDEEDDEIGTIGGADFSNYLAFRDAEGDRPGALANLSADMTARLAPLPAGRWRIGVRRHDGAWTIDLPQPLALANGETAEADVKFELLPGSAALVDATTGTPLVNAPVRWLHETAAREVGVAARTDGEGRLALVLPRGQVKVWFGAARRKKKEDPALATEFEWPPPDGTIAVRRGDAR